jgi:hypothetical protein
MPLLINKKKANNLLVETNLKDKEHYECVILKIKKEESNEDQISEKDSDTSNDFSSKKVDIPSYNNFKVIDFYEIRKNDNSKKEIDIIYKIDGKKKIIRLFGKQFYERNKNICKIKINDEGKELNEFYEITQDYEINNRVKNIINIKFIWEDNLTDLSYMFADCHDIKKYLIQIF